MAAQQPDPLQPDLAEARRFLNFMAEGDEHITFQTFADSGAAAQARVLIGSLDQHAEALVKANRAGAGIFWTVNFTDFKGRRAENVTGIRALFVDLDGAPLGPVLQCGLVPHAVVESSPSRWHGYWLVSGCELADFGRFQKALAARFGSDPKVHDLPRVMRLPGFIHQKAEPFRTRIIELHELQPYPVNEVVAALGLSSAPKTQTPPPAASGGLQRDDRPRDGGAQPVFAQGGRNAALARVAGSLRRQGLSAEAIEAALLKTNTERCRPPLPDDEVRRIAASIGRYPAGTIGERAEAAPPPPAWPDPLLPGTVRVPEIPADVLPTWAGAMAAAVAASTQTPPALAVTMLLAVLAACLQRRFEVQPYGTGDDYREPLSLWTVCALGSGNRKTSVFKALAEPLVSYEKREGDRLRRQIDTNNAQREVIAKRIEALKLQAGKEDDPKGRDRLRDEIAAAREAMPNEMFAPRIFTGDCTAERLQQLLVEQDERMAVLSDEGGIFGIMAGAYSGGAASIDVYLQGHAGAAMRVDRAGRLAHLDRPAVSVGLAIQPGVVQDQGRNKRFRDSGLMARFLYAVPLSTVGTRDVRARVPVPDQVRNEYANNVFSLLNGMLRPIGAPRVLPFASDARECWLDLCERIERQQGEGSRLAHMADWTAKLPGAAARMAGLLALAEYGTGLEVVPLSSAQRAVRLADLLVPHAEAAFALMGASDQEGDAVAVLAYLRRHRLETVTRRELQKAMEGRFRSLDRLLLAIKLLQDWHVLGREYKTRGVGRPSNFYEVNPKCFVDNSLSSP